MGGSSSTAKYTLPSDDHYGDWKEGQYYVTNPWDKKPIVISKKGPGSTKPMTVFEVFDKIAAKNPNSRMFAKEFKNDEGKYEWKEYTRKYVYDTSKKVARAFIKMGLKDWESVCIMGFNAPRWVFSYLASMYAGGLACGIYTTNNPGQCEYIVNHCKARIAVLENKKQLDKFLKIRDNCEGLKYIVLYDDVVPDGVNEEGKAKVITWDEMLAQDDDAKVDDIITDRVSNRDPGQCCSLIYTSGTTGKPKGVMMSHDNLIYGAIALIGSTGSGNLIDWSAEQRLISYLPLSHVAAQFLDIICTLLAHYGTDGQCNGRGCSFFARPDALKGSIKTTLFDVKPTIFMGVPRVWEKLEEGIKAIGKKTTGAKKNIAIWAKRKGFERTNNKKLGGNGKVPTGWKIANSLVFGTIKQKLGLDDCRLFVTAAAPIKKSTLDFFASLDIDITQAYGASESGGTHTIGLPFHDKYGTIGVLVLGNEIKIEHDPKRDKKGEGELLLRGRNIMMGYLFDPDKSKKTINNFGYYMSGDVGRMDKNNLYYITGRIKELIITAGGENVAPVPIEDYIKGELEAVSNVVLIGDQKKYLVVLITLKCKQNLDTQEFSNDLVAAALEVDPKCKTVDDARKSEIWTKYIEAGITKYNKDTNACVSNAQRVQYFKILDKDFSIPGGELTGTMKIKRPIVYKKYATEIESLYDPSQLPKRKPKKAAEPEAKTGDAKVEDAPEAKVDDTKAADEPAVDQPKPDENKAADEPAKPDEPANSDEPAVEQPKPDEPANPDEPAKPNEEAPPANDNANADDAGGANDADAN